MSTDLHQTCGRFARPSNRREFLARAGAGLGALALADLLCRTSPAAAADDVRLKALADFCQSLFGLNEFIYVD